MVDIDDIRDSTGKSKEESSSSSSGSSGDSGGSSGSSDVAPDEGPFSLDDDEVVDPSDNTMSRTSKKWADEHGELNHGRQGSENLQQYMHRQKEEVEELHENIREMAKNNNENFDEFTLFMHAMFLNFGQNRAGIMETIKEQYGKSDKEAYNLANKICQKAGEKEFMEQMVRDITENLAEL